jgi:hypothetical protein
MVASSQLSISCEGAGNKCLRVTSAGRNVGADGTLSTPVEEQKEGTLAPDQVGSQLDEGGFKAAELFIAETFAVPVGGLQHLGQLLRPPNGGVDGFKDSTARRVAYFHDFEL